MLQGIHHISLKAAGEEQFQRALDFYTGVLGAGLVRQWGLGDDRGAMLELGNTLLEVMANGSAGDSKGPFAHIAFRTDDVDAAVRAVEEAGCPVFLPPSDKNLGGDYPIRIAFCTGPAGEDIEFFQER
ncbi:hypothetical protein CE91St43_10840 [Oscillospiraceae bacterium]|nr:hypothetical protein CE91St43_10840 [Oscillospiraceae bacterium]